MTNKKEENVSDKILTVPNFLSLIRICLIPVFIIFLLQQKNIAAFLIFIISSVTDGLDGWIARKFNQVTKLGKILDPIADRGLLISAAIILTFFVDNSAGRLPIWIFVLILIRDGLFLCGGGYLFKKYNIKIPVIFLGKVATTFLYIGFALLILAMPWGYGIGILPDSITWFPGLTSDPYFYGIWPVYIGLLLNILTSSYYLKIAIKKYNKVKNAKN